MKRICFLISFCLLTVSLSLAATSGDRALLRWVRGKPVIDSIVIEGNGFYKDSEIKKQMYSKKRNFIGWIKGDRRTRVQKETLKRDTLEVKYMYLVKGFLGVRVEEKFEVFGEDSTALVRVKVDEGRQYYYGDKKLSGSFDEKFAYRLNQIINELEKGEPVNFFGVRNATFDMKTILANNGYPYARITYQYDTISDPPLTPVSFYVESDSIVHFGDVTVRGTDVFPDYTARRELKIDKGAVYRREDILDSQTRLFEAGYFSTFQLNQATDSTANRYQPDFVLTVRERKPLYASFETGATQSEERDLEWDFSTSLGKRNFMGSRTLELLTDYSFSVGRDTRLLTHKYRLRFTDPWLLNIRMPLSLTAEVNPRIKDATQDFDKESWLIAASTVKRYGREIKVTLGFEYQSVDISGIPEDQIEVIKEQEGNSARRKMYFNLRRDSRDDLFVPRKGSMTEFYSEFFGGFLGGDENFYKLQASWSRYQILWPGWIAATRVKAGWAKEFGSSEFVPSDELLYVGGANTVRGFKENTLGPLLPDGDPKGARFIFICNQEFRWKTLQLLQVLPLIGDFFKALPLWQSVFFDIGNGFENMSEFRFEDLAYSYGTGLQIISPAGPIRLDYARRIETDRFDFESRLHFTILYAF